VIVETASNVKGNAMTANTMTEYQNIAAGLLGLTHPEIYFSARNQVGRAASSTLESEPTPSREPNSSETPPSAAVRAVKFAFAALLAGSRAIPLGDNRQLIRQLGAYGERLRH
jgi:hypothetical protein